MKPLDRERVMHRIADLIEAHADELAQLEALDNGKSVVMARHVDVKHVIEVWRYMAGLADQARRADPADLRNPRARAGICGVLAARAGRRGRGDHRVEFPAGAGHVENCARARSGLHGSY